MDRRHEAAALPAFDLEIFVTAQNKSWNGYTDAANQLKQGRKSGHWMWYIFPQVEGLSDSFTSAKFAIRSIAHARAYLQHDVLGYRLGQVIKIVHESPVATAEDLFCSEVDASKLQACLTLFQHVASDEDKAVFQLVLDKYFEGKPHEMTVDTLKKWENQAKTLS